MFFWW